MKLSNTIVLFSIFLSSAVIADTVEDVMEVYTDESLPSPEQDKSSGLHGILGAGVFAGQHPVGEEDAWVLPLPLVVMRYKDIAYWSIGGGGLWLLRTDDQSLKLGVGLRNQSGWKPGDEPILAGMERRDRSVDGYLNASWKTSFVTMGAHYYHDIGGVSGGGLVNLRLSHSYMVNRELFLTPSLGVSWQDKERVDYYYGVRPEEALPWRPAYSGNATFGTNVGLSGIYLLSRDWVLLGGVIATRYGDEIVDSPIVSRRYSTLLYAGGGWRF